VAGRRREGAAGERLSVEAAHYYARIYAAARAGCLAELRRAGCGEEEAEDIFAATLERIMRKFDPTDSTYVPAQMIALLKRACCQKLIDERRHRDVLQLVPLEDASPRIDGAAESPVEAAEEREAVAMGREAISSLPERERAIFFQRHQLNLTPEEILGRNPGLSRRTYRKVMQRANARALKAFEEIGSGARCAQMQRGHLHRYVSGEAAPDELATVRAHLRHCRACQLGVARMRTHLHDVASGLAAVIAVQYVRGDLLGGWMVRLADLAGRGADALGGVTRAGRERLRDLALRVATARPGSGGESAAGQLVGISGAKAVSVCAAGAITVGCLAAGVVPGIGALEPAEHHRHRNPPRPAASRASSPPAQAAPTSSSSLAGAQPAKTSTAGGESKGLAHHRTAVRAAPEPRTEFSPPPAGSGSKTGAEFGVEGAGTPVNPPSTGSSGGGEASHSGGGESLSRSAGTAPRSESKGGAEFGF
jgi:RNA polymerase sigma factor (sigma-70 family)